MEEEQANLARQRQLAEAEVVAPTCGHRRAALACRSPVPGKKPRGRRVRVLCDDERVWIHADR